MIQTFKNIPKQCSYGCPNFGTLCQHRQWRDGGRAKDCPIQIVYEAPTVDVAPVVHAHWVGLEYDTYADGAPCYDVWECSNCKDTVETDEDGLTNYCPTCGAKMDESAEKTHACDQCIYASKNYVCRIMSSPNFKKNMQHKDGCDFFETSPENQDKL